MRRRYQLVWLMGLSGCAHSSGTEPAVPAAPAVEPALVEAEEARLLAPLRRGYQVQGDVVTVEMTSNFRGSVLLFSGQAALHELTTEETDEWFEKRWVNVGGGEKTPVRVRVGDTVPNQGGSEFRAGRELRQRILSGTHAFTMRVVVEGHVIYVDDSGSLAHADRFVIDDGKVEIR